MNPVFAMSRKYPEDWTKVCFSCKRKLRRIAFHNCYSKKDGLAAHCIECRNKKYPYDKNAHRIIHIRNRYGLEWEDLVKIYEKQGKKCKICDSYLILLTKEIHLDHDHITGKLRGLLCGSCNRGLGQFKDNINLLQKAIDYLVETK